MVQLEQEQGLFRKMVNDPAQCRLEDVSHVLAPSKGLSKLIPIDEEPNHQIVHALRF